MAGMENIDFYEDTRVVEEKSRAGRQLAVQIPIDMLDVARFYEKIHIDKSSECWNWKGKPSSDGYGRMGIDYKVYLAHRVSYVLKYGEPPPHMVIDHVCRNRICINPDHLEVVSLEENIRRGVGPERMRESSDAKAQRTHCKNGHPFSGYNLSLNDRQRLCKTCHRQWQKDFRARKKAKELGLTIE